MRPASNDPTYLKKSSRAVIDAMRASDAEAVWLMQGWLFLDSSFWTDAAIEVIK